MQSLFTGLLLISSIKLSVKPSSFTSINIFFPSGMSLSTFSIEGRVSFDHLELNQEPTSMFFTSSYFKSLSFLSNPAVRRRDLSCRHNRTLSFVDLMSTSTPSERCNQDRFMAEMVFSGASLEEPLWAMISGLDPSLKHRQSDIQ